MKRAMLFSLALGLIFSVALGLVAGQDGKDKKDDKKPPPKKEDDKILGKTVGEWIKILRTHENPKYRRAALIALEASNEARNTGLEAVLDTIEKDKDIRVRQDAVNLLGRLGPEVKPGLRALIGAMQTDKAKEVRESAAAAIAANTIFCERAADKIDAFIAALKDEHAGVRIAAAGVLRNMGESAKPAVPALLDAAAKSDEHVLVRVAAIHVVSRYGVEYSRTLPLLLDLAKKSDTPGLLRESAVESLGRSDSDAGEVSAVLSVTLVDKNVDLRKASAAALSKLGVKAKAAWPTVKARLSDKNEKDSSVRNHLVRLTGILGKSIDEAIPALTSVAVADASTENRIAAIEELGELGSRAKSALEPLAKIARADARFPVRDAANKAVMKIKTSQ